MAESRSKLSVTLVQRQTVDWINLSDEQFRDQARAFCQLWGKPDDYVWCLFQLWNATFTTDYREVRQQLKQISLANFRQAREVTFIPYESYQNLPYREGYYVFLDDDDWVDPGITQHLSMQLTSYQNTPPLILWRSANIGSPNQEFVVFVWGMNGRCMTNNYAVHSSWLQPFSKIHEVLQHKDAEKIFAAGVKVPHLDCALTVSNKSPISSVSLDRGLQGDLSLAKLIALVENYLTRMRAVKDSELVYMPWSRPLVNETIAVFERVLLNKS